MSTSSISAVAASTLIAQLLAVYGEVLQGRGVDMGTCLSLPVADISLSRSCCWSASTLAVKLSGSCAIGQLARV